MERKIKILLVEDNPADVRLLQVYLQKAGMVFELQHLTHLNEVITNIDLTTFDVVLLDLNLPDADWSVTLRQLHRFADKAPVIVFTGVDDREIGIHSIRIGAQDYLVKGHYNSDSLARTLAHARERFQLSQDLKASRDREWQMANYDGLTGLPNRRQLEENIKKSIIFARRANNIFAVLFIDLDRFKPINDSFGHEMGDVLLKAVSLRLNSAIRSEDMVARQGGDEFVVLLRTLQQPEDAGIVAQKLIEQLNQPFELGGREVFLGASIGIAVFPIDSQDCNELIQCADLAMYQAKNTQGNSYRFYSEPLSQQASTRLNLESDLRQALVSPNHGLRLHYQPIVSVSDNRIVALEALIRWQHDSQPALLPPAAFIPLAEETDLILALDAWILQQACQHCQQWLQKNGADVEVSINVNLSTRHFRNPDQTAEIVRESLLQSALPASRLELEITETALIQQPEVAARILTELRAMGVRIALDDFGAGYTSLSHLEKLPLDTLKIDRAFLQKVPDNAKSTALLATILQLAQILELTIIVEGVENQAQLDWLREQGNYLVQGYLLAKPAPEPIFQIECPSIKKIF